MVDSRLVLVDTSHMAFNFMAVRQTMTWQVNVGMVNDRCERLANELGDSSYLDWKIEDGYYKKAIATDTRIPAGIVKNIWRWSNGGEYVVIPCFDRPCPARKTYFMKSSGTDYKEGRSHNDVVRVGLENTERILRLGGIPVLSAYNYEADDLIAACVSAFYDRFDHIDVVTGDFDLVPLVDEKISVFLRCSKNTYAEDPKLKKNKYMQITPRSYEEIGYYWSKCSKIELPYNSMLLQKMLQGDESDAIPGIRYETSTGRLMRKYADKKYNELISQMASDGVDFSKTFRYDVLGDFSADAMREVLAGYLDEDDLNYAMSLWKGMDLNGEFTSGDLGEANSRFVRGKFEVGGSPVKPGRALHDSALLYGINV